MLSSSGRVRSCLKLMWEATCGLLGVPLPSRMDAESGPRLLVVAGPGSLGPGLLLILNDELVSRIHLANVYLSTDYSKVSFGFIH